MSRVLGAVGRVCARRRAWVLVAWVLLVGAAIALLVQVGPRTGDDLAVPGTGSSAVANLLAAELPPQQNGASPLVFSVPAGTLTDATRSAAVRQSLDAVRALPYVHSATDPTAAGQPAAVSPDGTTALSSVLLDVGGAELTPQAAQRVLDATAPAQEAGIAVTAGGSLGSALSTPRTESTALVGVLAAVLVVGVTVGSLVATGLPLLAAGAAVATGLAGVGMLGHATHVATVAPLLATMLGLGFGNGCALLLLVRHRAQLRAGMEVRESVATAVATSGRSVVVGGVVAGVALLAVALTGSPLVTSLGYAGAAVVLTSVLAAVTLLPALLSVAGTRVGAAPRPRRLRRTPRTEAAGGWFRWAGAVTRRPWVAVLAGLAVLLPPAYPLLSLRLGQEDVAVARAGTVERRAFDEVSDGFGPGYAGPLVVAVALDPRAGPGSEFSAQSDQAAAMQAGITTKQGQLTALRSNLATQQRALKQQQGELQKQSAALQTQQADLQRQQSQLQSSADALTSRSTSLTSQADSLRSEEQTLSSQAASLQSQSTQTEAERLRMQREAVSLRQQRGSLFQQRRGLVVGQKKVLGQLGAEEGRRDRLTAFLARLDSQIAKATPGRKAYLVTVRAQRAKTRDTVIASIAAGRSTLASSRAAARRLLDRASTLGREAQALDTQSRALKGQAEVLQRQAADLQTQATAQQAQASDLQSQADSLRSQQSALQAQAGQLQRGAANLQQQSDRLTRQEAALGTQATTLSTQGRQLDQEQADTSTQQAQVSALEARLTAALTAGGGDERGTDPRLVALARALASPDDVVAVSPPSISRTGTAASFTVVPGTRPADTATADLVAQLRGTVLPAASQPGVRAYVGGAPAAGVDLADRVAERLPLVVLVVVGLTFLLLLVAFRSVLAALQVAAASLLCSGAALGALTACFSWGWGLRLIGVQSPYGTVTVPASVPVVLFSLVFGMAALAQVVLVDSVQRDGDLRQGVRAAVRGGLAVSAGWTVAASAVVLCIAGGYVANPDPTVKQLGLGVGFGALAAGVAAVLLTPGLLAAFGRASFWLPGWMGGVSPGRPDPDVPAPMRPDDAQTVELPVVSLVRPAVRVGAPDADGSDSTDAPGLALPHGSEPAGAGPAEPPSP